MKNRIISDETLKKVIFNILKAVGIVVYFIVLILAFNTIKQERLVEDIKVFSGVFLILALIVLERAYKKDSGVMAITSIELMVISLHSLSIMHMTALLKYDFKSYMIASSVVFGVYYVLKAIIVYTKGRKDYLKSLNDISEIVKKDEPLKKEAKKRKKEVKEDG